MATTFKELLAADRLVRLFQIGRTVHPVTIDLFGLAGGYDGFWIDQEHGGLTYEQIQLCSLAARANNFDCFVRMAPTNYAQVTQNLEAGAGGVMAARIESVEQAEEFVRWAKFAPRGIRGMNTSGWDARYTHKSLSEFAADANREQFVAIQIEMVGALEDCERIAALEDVDLLFVGPSDLSQALGRLGQPDHADVWAAIERVAAACRKHGKHWGIVPVNPTHAERCVELGCRMLHLGSEVTCLRRGIEATKSAFAAYF